MTPWAFTDEYSNVDAWDNVGNLDGRIVYDTNAARPTVSLNSGAITGGSGTMSNPFTVGT